MRKQIDIQGHRGARGHFPENTIAGFIAALEMGALTIEMDVVISADRRVVVSHEAWMNEVICSQPDGSPIDPGKGKSYNIYKMSYEEVRKFDCGKRGHPDFPGQRRLLAFKPLLGEAISAVESHVISHQREAVYYNIEIKTEDSGNLYNPSPGEYVELVLREIAAHSLGERISLQSFDTNVLKEIRFRDQKSRIGLLVENEDCLAVNLERLGFVPDTYNPEFNLVNEDLIKEVQALGMKLIPWTVNERSDMRRLIEMGVDGIITDYPDRLADLVMSERLYK